MIERLDVFGFALGFTNRIFLASETVNAIAVLDCFVLAPGRFIVPFIDFPILWVHVGARRSEKMHNLLDCVRRSRRYDPDLNGSILNYLWAGSRADVSILGLHRFADPRSSL